VAFALQADGWWLRSDIVWAKGLSFCDSYSGSCMPESVRDRPTKGHEYVLLLAKNKKYFYDGDAVREESGSLSGNSGWAKQLQKGENVGSYGQDKLAKETGDLQGLNDRNAQKGLEYRTAGRNLRTVWAINPGSYAGAHFATFPSALVEPMIRAGTSQAGCCSSCGAPWERVTTKTTEIDPSAKGSRFDVGKTGINGNGRTQEGERYLSQTTGWRPTCQCCEPMPNGIDTIPFEPIPCTVLDPFLGSGTTADVARQLGRRWIGIELSKAYCDDHIIPRLSEPLLEWAEKQEEPDPEPVQLGLL